MSSTCRFNVGRFAPEQSPPDGDVLRLYDLTYAERIAQMEAAPIGRFIDMNGMLFKLGPSHLRPSELEPFRLVGDPLADSVSPHIVIERSSSSRGGMFDYGYEAVARVKAMHAAGDPAASALMANMRTLPSWADMARVRSGAEFFCANVAAAGTCLMNLSLIGGFGAWRINKVLESTGYLAAGRDDVHRRLLETLSFVLSCCRPSPPHTPQAMEPGGDGWLAVFAVRMLHSNVRVRLTSCGRSHWNVAAYGLPINAEDMSATLLGFSAVVLLGLERAGHLWHVSDRECEDYMHLWRLIGHWLGLPAELTARFDSVASSQRLLESVLPHIISSDESSSRLVFASLRAVAFRAPFFWSMCDLVRVSRAFSGDFLADCIGIPRPNDPRLGHVIQDCSPRTSFPSEIKHVACDNPHLALASPPSPPMAAKLLVLLVSSAFRCVKSACGLFSTLSPLPLSFKIMPYIVRHERIRRWLAPKMHDRVARMVDHRLGFCK